MKRIQLLIIFIMSIFALSAQKISYSANLDGTWDKWTDVNWKSYVANGEFRFYSEYDNPRDYFFKVKILGADPTKEEIKKHQKNKEWYTYKGTLEYFVDDDYPTAYSVLQKHGWLATRKLHNQKRPILTKTTSCTVKLHYDSFNKKANHWTINIIFYKEYYDEIAVGVSVYGQRLRSSNE